MTTTAPKKGHVYVYTDSYMPDAVFVYTGYANTYVMLTNRNGDVSISPDGHNGDIVGVLLSALGPHAFWYVSAECIAEVKDKSLISRVHTLLKSMGVFRLLYRPPVKFCK